MLLTLLVATNSVAFIAGAFLWVQRDSTRSISMYLVAAAVGLSFAIANGWIWYKVADWVTLRLSAQPERVQERYLRALYLVAGLWVFGATALGYLAMRSIARIPA